MVLTRAAISSYLFLTVSLLVTFGNAQSPQATSVTIDSDPISRDILAWRKDHEARFASPSGWLALTGHYWLSSGSNSLGTDAQSKVVLPKDAARDARGSFNVDAKGVVTLHVEAGEALRINDAQPAGPTRLEIDSTSAEADGKDRITIGDRLRLQLVRRAGRFAVRMRDSQSELIRKFTGKHWFSVRNDMRVTAKFVRFTEPKPVSIINIRGDEVKTDFAGTLEFTLLGTPCTLDAIEEEPGKLFVIFKDLTNGRSTYGAGRFVDVGLAEQGEPVIDFNKSYSPPCAWSPHTLCPIPPKQNHLPLAIEAGEAMVTPP